MSWYGMHPRITKEQARSELPKRACRLCVYWKRVFPTEPRRAACPFCGAKPKLRHPQAPPTYLQQLRARLRLLQVVNFETKSVWYRSIFQELWHLEEQTAENAIITCPDNLYRYDSPRLSLLSYENPPKERCCPKCLARQAATLKS